MPTNDEGEFELILGNRQLLSVFFIVVILLGVFFTMGYIVGRNSSPVIATDSPSRKNDSKPLVVESTNRTPEPQSSAAPKETAVQQPIEPVREPEPKPKEIAKAEPVKPEPPPVKEKETPKERRAEAKAKKEAAAVAKMEKAKSATGNPSGTYLQLAATTQREAEIMVDVLRKKEFKAVASEVPEKPGLFRVLVGPVADSAVTRTRNDLQGAGFPGDKAIKKTF